MACKVCAPMKASRDYLQEQNDGLLRAYDERVKEADALRRQLARHQLAEQGATRAAHVHDAICGMHVDGCDCGLVRGLSDPRCTELRAATRAATPPAVPDDQRAALKACAEALRVEHPCLQRPCRPRCIPCAALALPAVQAALTADTPKEPRPVECGDCDGCGWTEGGVTIKTTCGTCKGTGIRP